MAKSGTKVVQFSRTEHVRVHPRVAEKRPWLHEEDVLHAWGSRLALAERPDGQLVALGFDAKGRQLEMVALSSRGEVLIFHAQEPATKKTQRELGLERGGRQ